MASETLGAETRAPEQEAPAAPAPAEAPAKASADERPAPLVQCTLGALLVALVDVVSANLSTPLHGFGARLSHGLFDVALIVALGALSDGLVLAGRRYLSKKLFWVALFALGTFGMWVFLDRIFARQADSLFEGSLRIPLLIGFNGGAGLGITAAWALGGWLSKRRYLFAFAPVAAVIAAVANEMLFRDDYIEVHTAVVWSAATLSGVAVARRVRAFYEARPLRTQRVLAGALALLVAFALVPPPNGTRLALFRSPGGVGAWPFALYVWRLPNLEGEPDPSIDPRWLTARTDGRVRPPSAERIGGRAPVVVFVTVDATRADDVYAEKNAALLPALHKLQETGTTFTLARSPGSQTAVSLNALFSGKYFSEMYWEKYGRGTSRFEYTVKDDTPRFVDALTKAGVTTSKVVALTFLGNAYAVAPGFEEEKIVTKGRQHARAADVVEPLIARIRKIRPDEPFFGYVHLTEPHAPYDRGKTKSHLLHDRYVAEIAVADTWIGRIQKALSSSALADRAILIVSSDHGEAFGEHGTWEHTKTIYEELVRVPLIVWGKGVQARRVDTPVTLMDLGPTFLDIFGLDTPDWMTGESLVPILAGGDEPLSRPILAEGRLRRAIYVGDLKVIVDLRRKTIEAYDLAKDPRELDNLYERDPSRCARALATLDRFFRNRAYTADGYQPLYKP